MILKEIVWYYKYKEIMILKKYIINYDFNIIFNLLIINLKKIYKIDINNKSR